MNQQVDTGKSTAVEMGHEYTLVQALKSDLDEVQRLDVEEYGNEAYMYLVLRQLLDISGELFQVCKDGNGNVIAYGIIAPSVDRDLGWLLSVVVNLPYRRKGIGVALVNRLLDNANLHSLKKILLTVSPSNNAAIFLYEKLGFMRDGREQGYYGKGEDRIIMRWSYCVE